MLDAPVTFIAHRGLPASPAQDNTAAAFQAAFNVGFREVELDVHQCLDGLVVHHDDTWDARPLHSMTQREMARRAGAPTLRQTLRQFAAVDGGAVLHLDVKCVDGRTDYADYARRLDTLLRSALDRWPNLAVRVSSFWPALLEALSVRRPAYPLGLIVGADSVPEAPLDVALSFVALDQALLLDGQPLPWLRSGVEVYVWTVNSSDALERALAHPSVAVRGVITDNAALLHAGG